MSRGNLAAGLDAYSRKARLAPVLLVVLPLVLGAIAWVPPDAFAVGSLVAVLTTAGVTFLLSEIGRDRGKRKEQDLIRSWNGLPSVRLLRHRDDESNSITRARYHSSLSRLIPGIALPTPADELSHPVAADKVYGSCVEYLREHTRNRETFGLLFAENVSYGFRRNLWAMKAAGVTCAAVGVVLAGGAVWFAFVANGGRLAVALTSVALNALILSSWLFRVSPDWVHLAAKAYGERLLATCEVLVSNTERPLEARK